MKQVLRYVVLGGFCCLAAVLMTYLIDQFTHPPARSGAAEHLGPVAINVRQFRPQVVVRPQAPIIQPPFISAREAEGQVADNELVLGVVVNDQARAYPINMLTGPSREIFNDELGGQAIAATW